MDTTLKSVDAAAGGTVKPCPIVVCTDNNYARYALPLFQSIAVNTAQDLSFFCHPLQTGR